MNDRKETPMSPAADRPRKLHKVRSPGIARTDAEAARLAKALGHPARVAIVRMLIECGECVCGTIVEGLPLSQATVSQPLKVLKEAGLIHGEIDGPRVCYCINPEALKRFKSLLEQL